MESVKRLACREENNRPGVTVPLSPAALPSPCIFKNARRGRRLGVPLIFRTAVDIASAGGRARARGRTLACAVARLGCLCVHRDRCRVPIPFGARRDDTQRASNMVMRIRVLFSCRAAQIGVSAGRSGANHVRTWPQGPSGYRARRLEERHLARIGSSLKNSYAR